jgi:26S proteasome regulatory subunit N12
MPEYSTFLDQLVQTVRNEIASCSEKAYTSLPLSDAAVLLFFQNRQELLDFANSRPGWKVNPTSEVIEFQGTAAQEEITKQELPKEKLVGNILSYAKELETIV